MGLLEFVSALLESCASRLGPDLRPTTREINATDLLHSFVDTEIPELVALARAGNVLRPDHELDSRIEALGPPPSTPSWLATLGDVGLDGTHMQGHLLGDGENILVGWCWPSGEAATLVAYIDHHMGGLVKDAFILPDHLDSLIGMFASLGDEEGMFDQAIAPADAKVRLVEALDIYDRTIGMPDTETWPMARPLLTWLVGLLPDGGAATTKSEWSESARKSLVADFLTSAHGSIPGLTPGTIDELLEPVIWFACDYGPGDPLRWSPTRVEILISDWYPRKVVGLPKHLLRRLPDVLAGFIRFAHERAEIPDRYTIEALEAVDRWAPALTDQSYLPADFELRIPDDPDSNNVDEGLDDPRSDDDLDDLVIDLEQTLIDLVGGPEAYAHLDDQPLPDAPFDWSLVPTDLHESTAATLAELDPWAEELFDLEVRTMARAVLAQVVATDPATFTRSSDTAGLAAAILGFLFRRLTERLTRSETAALPWKVESYKGLAGATGVSPSKVSSRSKTVGNVLERSEINWSRLLHSTQRREVLAATANITAWRQHQADGS